MATPRGALSRALLAAPGTDASPGASQNARECADVAGALSDDAEAVVASVRDEDVACGIDRNALRAVQLRAGCRAAVAGCACLAIACDCSDDAGEGVDAAREVVAGIGDVEIAR